MPTDVRLVIQLERDESKISGWDREKTTNNSYLTIAPPLKEALKANPLKVIAEGDSRNNR